MQISYDYYRVFYYVAKYKNFTQAARVLMNNQPNITRIIKNLENELNCQLFIRSNRGVKLTAQGEKLYKRVQIAVAQLEAAEAELSGSQSLTHGTLSIGASETALHCLLLSVLSRFHDTYPGIKLRISNHSTPQAVAALKNGDVDIAVVTTPTNITADCIEIPLATFKEVLVCGPDFAGMTKHTIHLSDLIQYPFICLCSPKGTKPNDFFEGTITYDFYKQVFAEYGITLTPDVEVATTDQIIPMVKNNLGIGFVPLQLATEELNKGTIYELKLAEQIPMRSICLIKRNETISNVIVEELEKMLMHQCANT